MNEGITALAQWQKSENLAKHLLTQHIPDSTTLQVQNLPDIAAMWKEIVHKYTKKGVYAEDEESKLLSYPILRTQLPIPIIIHLPVMHVTPQ
jgi:hypothetical protein